MTTTLILRRELGAYARSPLGAIIVAAALLVEGIWFYATGLSQRLLSFEVLTKYFDGAAFITGVAALALTIRLIAEERQTGTVVLLNTSPVSSRAIVLGKFLSVLVMLGIVTALSAYLPLLVLVNGKVSAGHILVGYAGVLLLGGAVAAIGLFASAVSGSQVVAAILGIAMAAALCLLSLVARAADPPLNGFLRALAPYPPNQTPFLKGVLELGHVAYYVMLAYFFLVAAIMVLDARRWR